MSEEFSIEFGPVEEYVWSGMARAGPLDTDMRLQLRIDGEYVPPMDEFNIDGKYNATFPPYNFIKAGAEFLLNDDQTADYGIGRIDWGRNDRNVTFRRQASTVDICFTYNRRGFWGTVAGRVFADGLIESGHDYLTLAREEIVPQALEQRDLYEPEAEMYYEELDELEALLDDLEGRFVERDE